MLTLSKYGTGLFQSAISQCRDGNISSNQSEQENGTSRNPNKEFEPFAK
jgi:hypothetical protein